MHLLLRNKHIAPKPRIARAPELVIYIVRCGSVIKMHVRALSRSSY